MSEFFGYYDVGVEGDTNKNSTLGHLFIFIGSEVGKVKFMNVLKDIKMAI